MDWNHRYADYIDAEGAKAIQALEKDTGKLIMAFPAPPAAAGLTNEQLAKIQQLEKKLCARLVAYDNP